MSKINLFTVGLLPFVPAYWMNEPLLRNPSETLPFITIGLICLGLWAFVGYMSYNQGRKPQESFLCAHIPAIIILIALLFQEFILNQYLPNMFVFITQLYFMPVLNMAARMINAFMLIIPVTTGMWIVSVTSFLLIAVAFKLGHILRSKTT